MYGTSRAIIIVHSSHPPHYVLSVHGRCFSYFYLLISRRYVIYSSLLYLVLILVLIVDMPYYFILCTPPPMLWKRLRFYPPGFHSDAQEACVTVDDGFELRTSSPPLGVVASPDRGHYTRRRAASGVQHQLSMGSQVLDLLCSSGTDSSPP